jgi:glycosyltransferase involved in cell wall biosynthesis
MVQEIKNQVPGSILFVHQGYELYGSDRTLIQSVRATVCRWPSARITVLLPKDGALRTALLGVVGDVRVADLWILRKSNLKGLRLRDLGGLLKKVSNARRMMNSYDVTYINTVTVLDYLIAGLFARRPRIVHVHEIPTGFARVLFSILLAMSRGFAIFNSRATRRRFTFPFWQRCSIVWNGVAAVPLPLETAHARLNLLVIGRMNSWKGQAIVLLAVSQMPAELRDRVRVRLVGGVFGEQDHFTDELVRIIAEEGLWELVEMFPFAPDPYPHYSWADIIVVPSTKPEPFGLVAIEAMAAGRAVIAANHGGLSEIVVDGVTGSFIAPGSVESLTAAILGYLKDPTRAVTEGNAGRARFAAHFEENIYESKITNIIAELAGRGFA